MTGTTADDGAAAQEMGSMNSTTNNSSAGALAAAAAPPAANIAAACPEKGAVASSAGASHANLPTSLPRDVPWYTMIFTPIQTLTRDQSFALGVSASTGFALCYATAALVDYATTVFHIGSLGPGQLCGFFFFYFSVMMAGFTTFRPNDFCDEMRTVARAAAEFGGYMVLFYLVDRTSVIPRANKRHDMDLFWTLWVILVIVALCTLRRAKPPAPPAGAAAVIEDGGANAAGAAAAQQQQQQALLAARTGSYHIKHLQRDQTEEWKGWMQVMFLWYHYFNATEIYNVIRLYIAAYVWMTGFGNFSYYYIKRDFCMNRFVAMQWRLNFMVTWTCAILGNEYMLYYICPLHTVFTLMIYFGLGIRSDLNYTRWGLVAKFAILAAVAVFVWDVKGVFQTLWKPLTFLLQYNDPYRPARPVMSEWEFRTYLDHLVWLVGMFMACQHPRFDAWLERLDQLPAATCNAVKGAVVAACCAAFVWYYSAILSLPKKEYNSIHPYTSFIPIILFIILRNIFTTARQYHLHLFEFLGKTTLETYIAQFHIWMATTGPNGSPKQILRILPEDWFVTNFCVVSIIFFAVSYRLFQCTNAIRPILVPGKASDDVVKRNSILGFVLVGAVYVVCAVMGMLRGGYAVTV